MAFFNKSQSKSNAQNLDYNGNHIYINGLLISVPNFKQPNSLKTNSPVTYDLYLEEFSDKFFKKIAKHVSDEETKKTFKEINESFAFALNNLVDIPSSLRDYFFEIVTKYIDVLKITVSFPETTTVNENIAYYLPLLKEISLASKNFLLNNK